MANTLDAVTPQLLAQGLQELRNQAIMPFLVNGEYSTQARQQGSTIDIPIASAITTKDVTPSANQPVTADIAPTNIQLVLDQWKEADFYLTDKEFGEIQHGTIPDAAKRAISSIADTVDTFILNQYTSIYSTVGTAGLNPFNNGTASDATMAGAILSANKADSRDRRFVVEPFAQAAALDVQAFQRVDWSGDALAIREGKLSRHLGFDFMMDQNMPTHTAGTLFDGTGHAALINSAAVAVGDTTVAMDSVSLTGTVVVGDIFTVVGDTQSYVVTTAATAAGNAVSVVFSPAAKAAWADNAVVTFVDSHRVNLAFHKDAIAFATAPLLSPTDAGLGTVSETMTDGTSGLTLRLEVTRQNKRTKFSYDILYGAELIRPELAVRVLGRVG